MNYSEKKKLRFLGTCGAFLAHLELKHHAKDEESPKQNYLDFTIPSNISICNDKLALICWGEKPNGILIKSRQIIESQKRFFEELWKQAKE